jgi:predicted kinase
LGGFVLIIFSGLPGTGKSALANLVGRDLRIPVLSVDPIEAAILRAGASQDFGTGLAAYLVVEALVDSQLNLGQSAIVDAVNSVEPAKEMWRRVAAKYGIPMKVIECRCSDGVVHYHRLASRRRGLEDLREPTWEQVERRRREYTPWVEPVLSVDSVEPLESNLTRALVWLGHAE